LPPDSGEIWFEGQMIKHKPPHRVAALGIIYVPRRATRFSALTVLEKLDDGGLFAPRSRKHLGRSGAHDDAVSILKDRQRQMGRDALRRGQQMLAMARAAHDRPKV